MKCSNIEGQFDLFHRIVSGMAINIYWDGRNVKTVSEENIEQSYLPVEELSMKRYYLREINYNVKYV